MNRTYIVTVQPEIIRLQDIDWNAVPKADIDVLPWGGQYAPQTHAQVIGVKHGLAVRMWTYETDARTVERGFSPNVYTDSCLEFFAKFDAGNDSRYLNFEFNSIGALYCTLGTDRFDRSDVHIDNYFDEMSVLPFYTNELWGVAYIIKYDFLNSIYTNTSPLKYKQMKGNFYKCGEKTKKIHYLCWNHIDLPEPDFHSPHFFGDIIVKN